MSWTVLFFFLQGLSERYRKRYSRWTGLAAGMQETFLSRFATYSPPTGIVTVCVPALEFSCRSYGTQQQPPTGALRISIAQGGETWVYCFLFVTCGSLVILNPSFTGHWSWLDTVLGTTFALEDNPLIFQSQEWCSMIIAESTKLDNPYCGNYLMGPSCVNVPSFKFTTSCSTRALPATQLLPQLALPRGQTGNVKESSHRKNDAPSSLLAAFNLACYHLESTDGQSLILSRHFRLSIASNGIFEASLLFETTLGLVPR
ncbi:hypothetical protein L218DRAFT_702444 [Marasmius fiardii PR-910]|nr:hypothetical protein L218DRAFT_702444 [Marasmius fiardii PR-910]